MFIHHVFFWLKANLNPSEKEKFITGLNSLIKIETVKASHIGIPAGTNRGVIDSTYSYSLLLHFENGLDEETYQKHPIHLEFVNRCADLWEKVVVYDSVDAVNLL